MINAGSSIVSENNVSLIYTTNQSVTVKKAPATIVAKCFDTAIIVKLPEAKKNAGRFIYVYAEIATPTLTITILTIKDDRIYVASSPADSVVLNGYYQNTLLFSDGLFWYKVI